VVNNWEQKKWRKKMKKYNKVFSVLLVLTFVASIFNFSGNVQAASLQENIANTAVSTIGVQYKYGGASLTTGFSAPGLVYYVYQKNGLNMPRYMTNQIANTVAVAKRSLQQGDLLLFSTDGKTVASVGIYVGNNNFVLASQSAGKVVQYSLTNSYFQKIFFEARRFPSVASSTTSTITPTTTTTQTTSTKTLTKTLADKIIATAEKYLGTPYLYGASSSTTKYFDCSSFTQQVFEENGISLPRSSREQVTVGNYVAKSNLQKGDLVFFSTPSSNGAVGHVAIYAGNGKIIHTYGSPGVTYSDLNSTWWRSHYITARRVIK